MLLVILDISHYKKNAQMTIMNYKYSFERKKINIQFDYVVGDLK